MGFRCLLGHDFGEPKLTRTQEEQGDEVIISVSEVKTCHRCGATRIVSENTEVTSIEQLTATATGSPATPSTAQPTQGQPAADTATPTADATAQPADATAESAQATTTDEQASGPKAWPEPTETKSATQTEKAQDFEQVESASAEVEAEKDPATDDGIILPNEREEPAERQPGEWPDFDDEQDADETTDTPAKEPTAWPEQTAEDTGYNASTPTDGDAVGPEGISFGGGFTPNATEPAADEADDGGVELLVDEPSDEPSDSVHSEHDTDTEGDAEERFTRADEAETFEPTVDDIETEFFCPECGLTRVSGTSSMRAGDICPECRRGYIAERPL